MWSTMAISINLIWNAADRLALPFFKIKHWQWAIFFVATLLALRLFLALTHEPHLGIDGGAYILSALEVQGRESTSVGFARPPLGPGWLLAPFINLMGLDNGLKVWTALFSVLPLLPVYLLTRTLVNKSAAIFAVAFMSVDMMQMEMMVTGSLPLIGFTLIGLAIYAMIHMAEYRFSHRHFWLLVISVGLLPYVNQTAAGMAVIILPVTWVALFYFVSKEKGGMIGGPFQVNLVMYVLPAAFLGGLLALGALPWYLANAPGNSELRYPGPLLLLVKFPDPALVLQFPIVVMLVYLLFNATSDYKIRALALVMGMLGVMILFMSYDEAVINILFRSRYFLSLLVYPCIAFLLCRTWPIFETLREDWTIITPMVAVWLILLGMQVFIFNAQTNFKDMIFPETVEALQIAKSEHPGKAIITNAYSLSHWVAAINQVEAPNTWSLEPSPFYKESDLSVRCLLGWIPDCNPQQSAQALNAKYILIDERMPDDIMAAPVYGAPDDEWVNMHNVPWLNLRSANGSVRLWEIRF
jgi:hypothetical protein